MIDCVPRYTNRLIKPEHKSCSRSTSERRRPMLCYQKGKLLHLGQVNVQSFVDLFRNPSSTRAISSCKHSQHSTRIRDRVVSLCTSETPGPCVKGRPLRTATAFFDIHMSKYVKRARIRVIFHTTLTLLVNGPFAKFKVFDPQLNT